MKADITAGLSVELTCTAGIVPLSQGICGPERAGALSPGDSEGCGWVQSLWGLGGQGGHCPLGHHPTPMCGPVWPAGGSTAP